MTGGCEWQATSRTPAGARDGVKSKTRPRDFPSGALTLRGISQSSRRTPKFPCLNTLPTDGLASPSSNGLETGIPMEGREPAEGEWRRPLRFPLSCPIAFSGDLLEGKGNVVNISKLGCAVQSDQQVEEGAHLNLFLRLPVEAVPMKIELAVVRWVGRGLFGVEFIRIHPTEQVRLHELIKLLELLPSK